MFRAPWLVLAACACMSRPAHAHSPIPGIEGFYVGLLHPFSTPAQVLTMLGLGLFISGFRQRQAQMGVAAFLVATLASIVSGLWINDPDPVLFGSALAICALAALWPGTWAPVALALIAIGGFLIGQASIPDPGPLRDRIITVAGSFVGANVGLLYVWGGVTFLKERYARPALEIAPRVLAAWLGAIALVMLALGFASQDAAI
jgi:hydrogenase/urease accessory protein HupE